MADGDYDNLLTEEALHEFESIWRKHHPGQAITPTQLAAQAALVLRAVQLVYRPIPVDKERLYQKLVE